MSARRLLGVRLGVFHQHAPRPLARRVVSDSRFEEALLPPISLVTPSYNQAPFIGQTIESVLGQAYPQLQYIVQDACSTDGTGRVLDGYAEHSFARVVERDGGQADGINRGFGRSNGEVMGWLNADDLLLPGALRAVGEYFHAHPHVDVLYGNRIVIDADGNEVGAWILPGHDPDVLRLIDYVPQETLFWRRRIWDKVGARLDDAYHFALDWDLILRFMAAGARFAHLPVPLGAFRVHESQKTSALIDKTGFREMRALRRRAVRGVSDRCYLTMRHAWFLARHKVCDFRFRRRSSSGLI